ncbi:MAG: tandem-95 repeat protein, partial [Polaribacter sp.]|nr:tandem-95 repeat protein [Polaribacter sp.]
MKKKYIFLVQLLLFLFPLFLNSQSWQTVGVEDFSKSTYTPSFALDNNNIPYIAFTDYENSHRVTVKKFDGTNWVLVGVVSSLGGVVTKQSLAFGSDNFPYLAFRDVANSNKTTVVKFNGTNWLPIGNIGPSVGYSQSQSLKIDSNNIPYLAHRDAGVSTSITIKKFDGNNWVDVGNNLSEIKAVEATLEIDSNNAPYIAYRDNDNSSRATVRKFDGTNWVLVGNPGFSNTSVSSDVSFALDNNNVPYFAYRDLSISPGKSNVMKFNGTNWVTVGNVGSTNETQLFQNIVIDNNNILYLAYSDVANSGKTSVKKFDGVNWITVGNTGFSIGNSINLTLAVTTHNKLYLSYIDNNTDKTSVKSYNTLPTATNVTYAGSLTEGQQLSGIYNYADANNDLENGTTYKWYRSDDNVGTNKITITNATAQNYTLTAEDVGKYINFEVTPKDGTSFGASSGSILQGTVLSNVSNAVVMTIVGTRNQNVHSQGGGYNPNTNEFWYPENTTNKVYVYNANNQFVRSFNSGSPYKYQLWMDPNSTTDFYAANYASFTYTRQNENNQTIWSYTNPNGGNPGGITTDANFAYVISQGTYNIVVLDKNTGVYQRTIALPGGIAMFGSFVIANNHFYIGGNAAWSNIPNNPNVIHQLDIHGNYITSIAIPIRPDALAFNGEIMWVSDRNSNVSTGIKISNGNAYFNTNSADVTPPTAIAQDISITLNTQGNASITAAQINNNSTDNSGGALTYSINKTDFTCDDLGINQITLSVADESGNSATAIANVTVIGFPVSQAQNMTLAGSITKDTHSHGGGFNPNTNEFWYPNYSNNTINVYNSNIQLIRTFNSGSANKMQLWMDTESSTDFYTANYTAKTFTRINENNQTIWSYTSSNGKSSGGISTDANFAYVLGFGASTIEVLNKNTGIYQKTISLPGNINSFGGLVIANNHIYIAGAALGWSTIPNSDRTIHQLDINGIYMNTIYLTNNANAMAFDGDTMWISANVNNTAYGVKISNGNAYFTACNTDTTPPTAIAQDITITLNAQGTATITAAQINNNSIDNSGGALTYSINKTDFTCDDLGINQVTLTVTDEAGNSAIATANVTVIGFPVSEAENMTLVGSMTRNTHSLGGAFNPNTNEFWYPDWQTNNIYVYNKNNQFLRIFSSGQINKMQLWIDSDSTTDFYTANYYDKTFTRINENNQVIWTHNSTNNSYASAITTDANFAYVIGYGESNIEVLDKNTGVYLRSITLPGPTSTRGILVANNKFYITGYADGWSIYPRSNATIHYLDINGNYLNSININYNTHVLIFDGEIMWISDGTTANTSIGVKISNGNAYYTSCNVVNTSPIVTNTTFTGTLREGEQLSATYNYSDANNDLESGSTYKWYRSDDNVGTNKTAIANAITQTYTLTSNDVNKYISFEVTPNDGTSFGSTAESSLQGPVQAIFANSVLTAQDDDTTVDKNSTNNIIAVLANDDFGVNQANATHPLTFTNGSKISASEHGGAIQISDNNTPNDLTDDVIIYSPPKDFVGVDVFKYTITDSAGEAKTATVVVTVLEGNNQNATPTAVNDVATVLQNSTDNVIDVLFNDQVGLDGYINGGLTMTNGTLSSASANGGLISIDNKGTNDTSDDAFLYTPAVDFSGEDTFQYTITDASGDASTATVTVTVTIIADIPIATDDIATVTQNGTISMDVLENDSFGTDLEANIDALTVATTSNLGGSLSVVNNEIVYTPATDFVGEDIFTYTIKDATGDEAIGTVTITVTPSIVVNSTPTAVADMSTVNQNSFDNIIAVLVNDDFGANGPSATHPLTFKNGSNTNASVNGGTISIGDNGTANLSDDVIIYSPAKDFNGEDTFEYVITDANGDASTATVTITVNASSQVFVPTAVNDLATVLQNSTNNTINVLLNDDFGLDGAIEGGLTMTNGTLSSASANGGLIRIDTKGTSNTLDDEFLYSPALGFSGEDTFKYTITDASGDASTATVTVTVTALPALGYSPDTATVTQNSTNNIIDVMANDTDDAVFGSADTRFLIESVNHLTGTTTQGGTVALETYNTSDTSDDVILYTPLTGFVGQDTFNYVPGNDRNALVLVTVTVTPAVIVNGTPTAVNDAYSIDRINGTGPAIVYINVTANDNFGTDGPNATHPLTLINGKTDTAS